MEFSQEGRENSEQETSHATLGVCRKRGKILSVEPMIWKHSQTLKTRALSEGKGLLSRKSSAEAHVVASTINGLIPSTSNQHLPHQHFPVSTCPIGPVRFAQTLMETQVLSQPFGFISSKPDTLSLYLLNRPL